LNESSLTKNFLSISIIFVFLIMGAISSYSFQFLPHKTFFQFLKKELLGSLFFKRKNSFIQSKIFTSIWAIPVFKGIKIFL
jgi:hypothetical protein